MEQQEKDDGSDDNNADANKTNKNYNKNEEFVVVITVPQKCLTVVILLLEEVDASVALQPEWDF